jgi:RND family efflux transporter MFP subunit
MNRSGLLVLLALAACAKASSPSSVKAGRAIHKLEYPVKVAPLERREVRYTVTAPGTIEAFQQVQITARVAGAVDKVSFIEGQPVKQGQVLVTIDGERYEVALAQSKATQAKVQANEQQAEAQLARRQGATAEHPGLIPGEEIASFQTAVATAKADHDAARQAVRVAELNLRDAYVRAPIAGIIQTRSVQAGQYLQPGAVLATLLQRDPLLLRFSVAEQDAPRLKSGLYATIKLRETARTYQAAITLVAGAADPQTRLVPVTAQVLETEHPYWLRPGAFCEVEVPVGSPRDAIVVPTLAVSPTERGNVVYVVDSKNVAHERIVALGMHTPDGGVEVTRGLEAGELLVVRGFEALSEGAPVKISERTDQPDARAAGGGAHSASDAGVPAEPSKPEHGGQHRSHP